MLLHLCVKFCVFGHSVFILINFISSVYFMQLSSPDAMRLDILAPAAGNYITRSQLGHIDQFPSIFGHPGN